MKKLYHLIILLLLLVTAAGCKKESPADMEQSLVGSWEIRQELGGQIAGAPGTYPPGNGRILQFTEKNCSYIIGTRVIYTGSYTIGVKGSGKDSENILNFIDNGLPRFFKIENKKLTVYSGPERADGNTLIYERVSDPVLETN